MSAGKILVVDDDPQIRRVLKIMLTGQGYEIDDAKCGEAALEKLRVSRFDLVLLDVGMPGMGGLETCRAIRDQSEIAIIMLTVRDRDVDKIEALDAGADDYVTKPFKSVELSARIRAALRRTPWTHSPTGHLMLGSSAIDFDTRQVVAHGRHTRPVDMTAAAAAKLTSPPAFDSLPVLCAASLQWAGSLPRSAQSS
jgi:two-component system, OmpR family, KDP operon response regulator KdpE